MILKGHLHMAATALVAAFTVAILLPAASTSADAHGVNKYRDAKKHAKRRHVRRYDDRIRFRTRRRDRAIFAHEVDLSRRGGPERFFELLSEENR